MSPRSKLPLVCCQCGTTEDVKHVQLPRKWLPGWMVALLMLCTGIVPGIVLLAILGKDVGVQVGVCRSHSRMATVRLLVGFGAILAGLGILCLGMRNPGNILPLPIGVLVAFAGVAVLAIWRASPIRVRDVGEEGVELSGGHPDFVAAVQAAE